MTNLLFWQLTIRMGIRWRNVWKERCTTTLVVSIEYPASQLDVFASIVTSARPNGPFGRRVLETIGFLYLLYRPPNSPYRSYTECIIAFSAFKQLGFRKYCIHFFFREHQSIGSAVMFSFPDHSWSIMLIHSNPCHGKSAHEELYHKYTSLWFSSIH